MVVQYFNAKHLSSELRFLPRGKFETITAENSPFQLRRFLRQKSQAQWYFDQEHHPH